MTLDPVNLGRYRVLGELGRGAMGVVYLAEDPSLKRCVAVKVVTSADRSDALARFQREAETAARLHHPNIVTVFDVGEEPGVGPFLAMERVEGVSLLERLQEGPLDPVEAMNVVAQAVTAVSVAHGAGVLHRDIKPGNFMYGTQGLLKLMDFGLAMACQPTTTALLCTPAYAAPELLRGQPPSQATDIWALVVTAWQILTGRLPFNGPTVAAVLSAIGQEPPDLSGSGLTEAQLQVFRRALDKDPAGRFPSAAAFLDALRSAEATAVRTTAQTVPAPMAETLQVPRPRTRRRWLIPAAVAGALLLLGGLAWAGWRGHLGLRRLTVLSTPRGAVVMVDGRRIGETPLVDVSIPPFARELRLEREGHRPRVLALRRDTARLDLRLEPAPVHVPLASDPDGAEVWLDGVLKGVTPLMDLEIPGTGRHDLQVRLKGYTTWTMGVSASHRPPARVVLQRSESARPARRKGLVDTVKGWFR